MERMKPDLTFALHAHQPVGNFDHVFEKITEESYLPFLKKFKEAAGAGKIGYHATGILYRWWENHQPEIIDLIGELVDSGRIELLTGGFYEPILPLIPPDDRQRQIAKHQKYLEDRFGTTARGLWLTERVWIPGLAADLAEAGLDYTIVDDFHFKLAGWEEEKLSGYYTTEYNGKDIKIFPISKKLRYRIPFHDVDRINKYLNQQDRATSLTMADDAEKFGSWPDTYKWVYRDGWLDRFLASCSRGEINLCSPADICEKQSSNGRCYLPTASYEEMLEWAMPAKKLREYQEWKEKLDEEDKQFARGGYFHNFLVKYEESNRLHKKMQWLTKNIDKNNSSALDNLLTAQCNDTYWHGVFGGLCLPHLRGEAWQNLTEATAKTEVGPASPRLIDYDSDGSKELLYRDDSQFLIIDPTSGGELITWELLEARRNLLDTLTRRWEAYLEEETAGATDEGEVKNIHHRKTRVPAPWLENWAEDPVPRAGFQVVALKGNPDPGQLQRNKNIHYILHGKKAENIQTAADSCKFSYLDEKYIINYNFDQNHLNWNCIHNDKNEPWGAIITIGLRSPDKNTCRIKTNDKTLGPEETHSVQTDRLTVQDKLADYSLDINCNQKLKLVTYPVHSLSRSEKEAEKIYQGTAIIFVTDNKEINLNFNWPGGTANA
ncbi:MAG: alpha-amylase/4-alpha-glucanotransferase domain-containing protein [bacterium]